MPKEKDDEFDFSEASSRLEEITSSFEKDEFDLEEGIEKFEEGLKLAKKLEKRLKEAENEIKQIKEDFYSLGEKEDADSEEGRQDDFEKSLE